MGLDIFLEKQTTFFESDVDVKVNGRDVDFGHIICITSAVGHWRNFYPMHDWFVENVQNGINDRRRYWILDDDLRGVTAYLEKLRMDEPQWMSECNDAIGKINNLLMEDNISPFITFYYQAI